MKYVVIPKVILFTLIPKKMKNLYKILIFACLIALITSCKSRKDNQEPTIITKIDTTYILDSAKVVLKPDTVTLTDTIPCPTKINRSGSIKTKATKDKPATEISYTIKDNRLEITSIRNAHDMWLKYYKQSIKESIKEQIIKQQKAKLTGFQITLLMLLVLMVLTILLVALLRK